MKYLVCLATLLVALVLSIEARLASTQFLFKDRFIVRHNARHLAGTTAKTTAATDDTTSTADDATDDDTISSGGKKSIASKTSSVPAKKKDQFETAISSRFVKPQTAAPSVAAPTPATVVPKETKSTTKKTNSTTTSTGTSDSSPSPADSAPETTMYPTRADPESIASKTSTSESSTKIPLSASMEFEKAQTASPVPANSTKLYSMQTNTTATTEASEDDYIPMNGTGVSITDDLVSTYSPQNATYEPKWIFPKEKKQSDEWPIVVGGMFVLASIVFFGATAFQNYRKRRDYEKIPVSLTV